MNGPHLSMIINYDRYDICVSTIQRLSVDYFCLHFIYLIRTYHATITYLLKTLHVKTKRTELPNHNDIKHILFDSHQTIETKKKVFSLCVLKKKQMYDFKLEKVKLFHF